MLLEIGIAAFVGAALALRFQVYILFPATLIAIPLVVASEVSTGAGTWWVVLDTVITVASLLFGYLIGAAVNSLVRAPGAQYERRTT